jgi:hypothetical protein
VKQGVRKGFGTLVLDNNMCFMGNFDSHGSMHDEGLIRYVNGGCYWGEVENNVPNGYGTMIYEDGNVVTNEWIASNE